MKIFGIDCGCAARRERWKKWILSKLAALSPRRPSSIPIALPGATEGLDHKNEFLAVLAKFGLDERGPDTVLDAPEKATLIYQRNIIWVIDYDKKTMKTMQAARREHDFMV